MADKPGVASAFPGHSFDNDGELILTGSASAYVATTARRIQGYYRGLRICGKVPATSTGATTIKVDEAPIIAVRKSGNAVIAAGDLVGGTYYDFVYDDANNVMQVDPGSATSLSAGGGIDITGGIVSTTIKRRTISDISGGDTVTTADRATRVRILAGTGTLSLQALATLGNGFWCLIHNVGTGDVTLDPNGAETIDGLANWVLYPGGLILLQVTASDITTMLLAPMRRVFTASDTWVKPGSGLFVEVEAWGAGGSGGRAGAADGGGAGGGGAYNTQKFTLASLSASVSVTIGAGGASRTADNTDGAAGGNTTFGAYLSAFGGGGGSGSAATNGGGGGGGQVSAGASSAGSGNGANGGDIRPNASGSNAGGEVSITWGTGSTVSTRTGGGNVNGGGGGGFGGSGAAGTRGGDSTFGGGGGGGGSEASGAAAAGGQSIYGGGGGGGGSSTTAAGAGGVSQWGGNGGAGNFDANNATDGSAPGGGGGGSETGNSGAGARGEVRVTIH